MDNPAQIDALQRTRLLRVRGQEREPVEDQLAREEPLEIRVRASSSAEFESVGITMRTPGEDRELALGLLYGDGLIQGADSLGAVQEAERVIELELPALSAERRHQRRSRMLASASCGVCGKATLEALSLDGCSRVESSLVVDDAWLRELPDCLLAAQPAFGRSGGLHACGLFAGGGDLLAVREDVGRHNALDKLVGHALLNSLLPLDSHVLMLSGRIGFELVQKAVRAGIPIVAAVGAPSSLAVEVADHFGITLLGFLREDRYNLYTHPERIRYA